MPERPILFSGPMVRALRAGQKTQTRRVVKPQFEREPVDVINGVPSWDAPTNYGGEVQMNTTYGKPCPYGKPGDRLWVRESWSTHACFDAVKPSDLTTRSFHYAADGACVTGKGRPSIHMPRFASRVLLEITEVRVERLQNISEADALAEGIVQLRDGGYGLPAGEHYHAADPRKSYLSLWEAINGEGSVEANPWVWAVSFKQVTP